MVSFCWEEKENTRLSLRIKDLVYTHLHRTSYFSKIRVQARKIYHDNYEYKCSVCGYNTIVEVAHIKAVSSFPEDTLVAEVNSLDNLIGLCPNHHWEMDHGLLDPMTITKPLLSEEGGTRTHINPITVLCLEDKAGTSPLVRETGLEPA